MLPGIHIDSIQEVVRGSSGVSPSKRNCININTLGIWKNDPLCPGKSTPIPFRGRYYGVCCTTRSKCDSPGCRPERLPAARRALMVEIFGIPSQALFGQLLIGLINGSF